MTRALKSPLLLVLLMSGVCNAEPIGPLELLPQVTVGTRGVFLSDLVTNRSEQPLPEIELAPAPQIGRPLFLSRYQVSTLLTKAAPDLACTNWTGAERVRVIRASRVINDLLLKEELTEVLQRDFVKELGDLELFLNRQWKPIIVPDDPLTLKVLDMPSSGVSPNFICRFELFAGEQSAGAYQQPLGAKVWREVFVARSNLMRGQALRDADVGSERRDILNNRDYLTALPLEDPYVEFRENVQAGRQITARSLRLRAIIKRGRLVDAMVQDESLTVSVKAEALEDGVPGQIVRVRNLRSRREFKGKVQDEQTVVVVF